MKDTFILKTEWKSIVDDLADRQAGVLIKAVYEYIATGDKPELQDGELKMAFKFMKMSIDAFQEKYQAKIEANRDSGKQGGAPIGNQNARKNNQNNRTVEKTTETTKRLKNNPTDPESVPESESENKPPPRACEDFSFLPGELRAALDVFFAIQAEKGDPVFAAEQEAMIAKLLSATGNDFAKAQAWVENAIDKRLRYIGEPIDWKETYAKAGKSAKAKPDKSTGTASLADLDRYKSWQ